MYLSGAIRSINLHVSQTVRLRGAAGVIIHCVSGKVWITQEGDAGDILLGRQGQFTVTKNGLVLLEALHEAKIGLDAP